MCLIVGRAAGGLLGIPALLGLGTTADEWACRRAYGEEVEIGWNRLDQLSWGAADRHARRGQGPQHICVTLPRLPAGDCSVACRTLALAEERSDGVAVVGQSISSSVLPRRYQQVRGV